MIQSETLDALAVALAEAQGEFEAVAKGSDNPFYKSKYAALPDVVRAATPILKKNGLSVSQLLGHNEAGDTLTTLLLHKSGQFIGDTMRLHLVPNKHGNVDPQSQGSATTYARRYSLMAVLGLVADEDDDGNKGSEKGDLTNRVAALPGTVELATDDQKERLTKAKELLGAVRFDAYLQAQGVDKAEDLTTEAAESVLTWARDQAKAKAA